ncbi:unnamed protein product [Dicrocoelium dendriticum]|nr:unnamed protein product [Dicrocoelium dendriticum]
MLADGQYVDGSWLLTVHIDELNIEKQIRVQGEWSVGEVLAKLTEGLPVPTLKPNKPNEISLRSGGTRTGWADYNLWWPAKRRWLSHNRVSLNQYGLQADALLRLISVYGRLRIQLPDLQVRTFVDVNFSEPVFRITVAVCRQLNIRHPEELSLAYPVSHSDLKHSRFMVTGLDRRHPTMNASERRSVFQRSATINVTHSQRKQCDVFSSPTTMENKENAEQEKRVNGDTRRRSSTESERLFGPPKIRDCRARAKVGQSLKGVSNYVSNINYSLGSMQTLAFEFRTLEDPTLASSPLVSVEDAWAKGLIVHPTNFMQRLCLNMKWLDSSKSLMEEGIDNYAINENGVVSQTEYGTSDSHTQTGRQTESKDVIVKGKHIPLLFMRFKYGTFYDLNPKYDIVRINQLYEQAKWSVLTEAIESTDDEACLLAALQAHVEIATEDEQREHMELSNNCQTDGQVHVDTLNRKDIPAGLRLGNSSVNRPRDTSPIGGYLKHHHNPRITRSRPLSVIELDSEIDAMLDDLSNYDALDATSIGGGHRSRTMKKSPRPLSQAFSLKSEEATEPPPPQMKGYVKVCKPRRFGIKVFRRLFLAVDALKLMVYKNEEDQKNRNDAVEVIYLPGCEVQPDLCLASERYNIRVFVPISRTNLPLSAAFNLNSLDSAGGVDEDLGVGGRLKRRASLLSLTSLSHFGASFGLQPTGSTSAGGGLSGASAAVLGLVSELVLRFSDADSYADWLAYLRLATAVPYLGLPVRDERHEWDGTVPHREWANVLNKTVYEAEKKAILSMIQLISPLSASKDDQNDGVIQLTNLHERLENRFCDFLPMRYGSTRNTIRTRDLRTRDQTELTSTRTGTVSVDSKPPTYSATGNFFSPHKASIIRRTCMAYSRIRGLTSIQAKMKYISAWEQMHNHGIVYFPARIEVTLPMSSLFGEEQAGTTTTKGVPWMNRPMGGGNITVSYSRRLEAIGIGPTRVYRCDLHTGDVMASWRLSAIQGWNINWELSELVLLITAPLLSKRTEDQRSPSPTPASANCAGKVIIKPVEVSVRTVAEFLGGYAFLNLRSPEKNQGLDERVYYKLTTGSALPVLPFGAQQYRSVHS